MSCVVALCTIENVQVYSQTMLSCHRAPFTHVRSWEKGQERMFKRKLLPSKAQVSRPELEAHHLPCPQHLAPRGRTEVEERMQGPSSLQLLACVLRLCLSQPGENTSDTGHACMAVRRALADSKPSWRVNCAQMIQCKSGFMFMLVCAAVWVVSSGSEPWELQPTGMSRFCTLDICKRLVAPERKVSRERNHDSISRLTDTARGESPRRTQSTLARQQTGGSLGFKLQSHGARTSVIDAEKSGGLRVEHTSCERCVTKAATPAALFTVSLRGVRKFRAAVWLPDSDTTNE